AFKRALKYAPNNARLLLRYAEALSRANRWEDAEKQFLRAFSSATEIEKAIKGYVKMLLAQFNNDVAKALKEWQRHWQKAPSLFLCKAVLELGKRAKAVEQVLKMLTTMLKGEHATARQQLLMRTVAEAYEQLQRWKDATAMWHQLHQTWSEDYYPLWRMAECQAQLGNERQADAHFRQALACHPTAHDVRRSYARFLTSQGRFVEAQTQCRIAIALGASPEVMYGQMIDIYERAGRDSLREAVSNFARMARKHPDDLALQKIVAIGYERLNQYKRALPYWRRVCALTEAAPQAVQALARCLEHSGMDEDAVIAYRYVARELKTETYRIISSVDER
ncbi:MAG TPA: tetratricopeptide repeat protein, partial [Armatimonadetes bacterium]|nr:tetratricopeptide repeat protein [Armatimonadota bacterium]